MCFGWLERWRALDSRNARPRRKEGHPGKRARSWARDAAVGSGYAVLLIAVLFWTSAWAPARSHDAGCNRLVGLDTDTAIYRLAQGLADCPDEAIGSFVKSNGLDRATDKWGAHIVHAIIRERDADGLVAALLRESPDLINRTDRKRRTALFAAIEANRPKTASILLKLGADPRVKSIAGIDAVQYCRLLDRMVIESEACSALASLLDSQEDGGR